MIYDTPTPRTYWRAAFTPRASERLGHSRIGITLDLYSHVLPGMQEDAASRVDDALRQALQKRTSGIR